MSEQYRTKLGLPPSSSSKQQKESPRTQSSQSQHHNQHRTAVSNKIIPNQKVIKNKIQIDSSSMNASSDENISNLMKYYKSLDVASHYVEKVMAVVNGLSLFKSSFITHEISKASTLSTNILKLNKNIDTRNKLVKLLQQYNTYLELNQKHSKEMLNDIKLIISDVRVVSINIVMLIKKIRKQYAYDALCGKFQKEFINKDRMYLRTMISDLAFLKGSVIGKEFQLGNDFDTFFTKLRMDVPYTTDRMGSMITTCQKYLIKEKVNMLLYEGGEEGGSVKGNKEDDRCKEKRNVVERCCSISYGAVKSNSNIQSDIKKMKVNSNSSNKFNNLFVLYDNEFSILKTTAAKKSKHVVNKYKVSKSSFEIARMLKQVSPPSQQQQQQQQVQLLQDNNNSNTNLVEYKYILLSGKLSQIQNEYNEYYNSIPSQIKIGFNINDNLNNYLIGVFPRFIKVVNNSNTMIGFITVSYFEANKLSITSISCNKENESHFSKFLIDLISYLKTTFTFQELYIELYYEKQGNDFILIKPLETSIKKEANFRWVSMVNDTTQRKIKYKIINNNFNPSQLNLLSNGHVLSINSLGLIEMGVTSNNSNEEQQVQQEAPNDNGNDGNDDGDSLGGEEYVENAHVEPLSSKDEEKINVFPVYSLLNEMMLNGEYNIDSETLRDINMESMQDMSNGIISNYIQLNRDKINEKTPLLKDMFIHKNTFNNNTNNILYCGTVMNVHLFFDNVFTVKLDNNKIYNCISTQIGKLVYEGENENDKDEFYLLKTKNEKISLLLYENNFKSKLNSYFDNNIINTKSLCEYINEIYPQMETLPSENENISSIYLPSITINTSCNYESPRILNEFTIASSSEEPENMMYYNIKQYEQNDRVIFNFDEQTTKNESQYIELDTNEIPLAKKIQKDFIIAVINYDTLSEFNYPCIAAYIIKI